MSSAEDTPPRTPSRAAEEAPRILLVDDESPVLEMCSDYLTGTGYTLEMARSAEEALQVLQAKPVDVIVADYFMPKMNGVELLQHAQEQWPETARILETGVADMHVAEEATSRCGIFRLLSKPFSPRALRSAVAEALEQQALRRENRQVRVELQHMLASQAEDLARTRSFMDSLLQALPVGVIALASDGTLTRCNPSAIELLGLDANPEATLTAREMGLPCPGIEACRPGTGQSKEGRTRVVDSVGKSGRGHSLLWSCEVIRNDKGEPSGCVASCTDITEKLELEAQAFEAKQEMEAAFDSITDPTFIVDRDLRLLRINSAYRRLLQRPFHEVIQETCHEVSGRGAEPCRSCPVRDVFDSGEATRQEFSDRRGSVYLAHYFPLLKRGTVENVVVRYQDVTSEREMEHHLLQSEKMASVGALAAGIAHEINNPTGFIVSNLNRLEEYAGDLHKVLDRSTALCRAVQDGSCGPEAAWRDYIAIRDEVGLEFVVQDTGEIVAECQEGAERIRKIVTDLKTFSRPGKQDWEYTDINKGLESTLNIVWNELKYNCEVVKEYGPLPDVLCLPQQINQVFMNLLVNAGQAIDQHGTITIRSWPGDDRVFVSVTDTGCGIPAEEHAKIFEPFFTTKPVGKGTGLGLHLAHGIVHKHGGHLRVASKPGHGSTFTVELPLVPPDAEEQAAMNTEANRADPVGV